jgi:hypothetical protein
LGDTLTRPSVPIQGFTRVIRPTPAEAAVNSRYCAAEPACRTFCGMKISLRLEAPENCGCFSQCCCSWQVVSALKLPKAGWQLTGRLRRDRKTGFGLQAWSRAMPSTGIDWGGLSNRRWKEKARVKTCRPFRRRTPQHVQARNQNTKRNRHTHQGFPSFSQTNPRKGWKGSIWFNWPTSMCY